MPLTPDMRRSIDQIRDLANGRPVAVHCASGFRSYLATRTLMGAGIPAANVSGGFMTLAVTQPDGVEYIWSIVQDISARTGIGHYADFGGRPTDSYLPELLNALRAEKAGK